MILETTEAEQEFRKLFRRLRKKYGLWMHLHSSVYEKQDDTIEIWRMKDDGKRETVCRVKEKEIEDCYRKAINDLKFYEKRMQEKEASGQEERIWK